ncbi:WD40 repeat-like protein [Blastocladiella emersonii ATCC 22665]|nr:WD40 repeat-like protein [Blastocladiella emersonii ATCC 22665]
MPPAAPAFTRESIWACLPATTRGQPVQLDAHPAGKSFLYTNGRSVIIRDLAHPELATEYTGHSFGVNVARFAPSGYYIASGDVRGNVRIWDATQPEQILKAEYQPLSGTINDLTWDSESKRLIAVGDGRDKFGHAFAFDTGSSVGEIVGHNKVVNAVSIRPCRPFRAVTCSDDMTVNFFNGVPYKFAHSISDHTRFVTSVRFSPNGAHFASVGLDGKIFLYDGATGNKVKEVTDPDAHHKGGIFALSWSPDAKQFITSSADSTVKLWDAETSKVVNTWHLDPNASFGIHHQQVGNLWRGDWLLSTSLSGDMHYLDPKTGAVARTVTGHQKNITAMTFHADSRTLFTASYDGNVRAWHEDAADAGATATAVAGDAATTTQVQDLTLAAKDDDAAHVIAIDMDDTLRTIRGTAFAGAATKLPAQPSSVAAANGGTRYVATTGGVFAVSASGATTPVTTAPANVTVVATSADRMHLAMGTADRTVVVAALDPATGVVTNPAVAKFENSKGAVTAIAFEPTAGNLLAVGDAGGKILVYNIADAAIALNQWVFHTARITSVAWSASGNHAVSTSLDTAVAVWSRAAPMQHVMIRNAHVDAAVSAVFVGDDVVASAGADGCVKHWKIAKMPGSA